MSEDLTKEIKETLFDLADFGYWSINMITGDVDASPKFWNILGYTKGDLEETLDNLKKIHYPSDWEEGWQMISLHLKGETPYYINKIRYLTAGNKWLWCEVRGKVIRWNEKKEPLLFVGYISDLSEQIALEDEAKHYKIQYKRATALHSKQKSELERAVQQFQELSGIIPICSGCKSIRSDKGSWKDIEQFVSSHSDVQFSHGLCDHCTEKLYKDEGWFDEYKESLSDKKKPLDE